MYYPRDIERTIQKAAGQFRVIGLTGARQTGKSTLLKRLFTKTHHYVSLDNPVDLKLALDDPRLFFREYPAPLIIDEIQYAPNLLRYIKMIVDASDRPGQFLITGSQKFTLMKGLSETLAGRICLLDLYPMSITEGPQPSRHYEFRALRGSYPELLRTAPSQTEAWFSSYLSTYIERDVEFHFRLEKISVFKDFIFLLAARIGQVLNCQSLAHDLGVSFHAVKSWVKILEASQIIYLLRPYYVNLGSRIVKAPKVYFTDVGLAGYITGGRDKKFLLRGPQAGALFENFVVQETLKHYANQGKPAPLFYYRTNNGLEVDLIIEQRVGVIQPCEIKLTHTPQSSMAQSIERLRNLNKNKITIANGVVICRAPKSTALNRTTRAMSLQEFLQTLS